MTQFGSRFSSQTSALITSADELMADSMAARRPGPSILNLGMPSYQLLDQTLGHWRSKTAFKARYAAGSSSYTESNPLAENVSDQTYATKKPVVMRLKQTQQTNVKWHFQVI